MKLSIGLIAILLGIGLAFAISPAGDWNVISTGRYTSATNASVTTEGGNVTNADLNSNTSTVKWAGFWGNITSALVLSPGVGQASLYSWAWAPANGGEVCSVPAASGFDWANVASVATTDIDTMWGFNVSDADSAANTLTDSACAITIGGTPVTTVGNKTGVGGFETCAVSDSATSLKSDFAFCADIASAGTLFNNQTGNYELIMPTNNTVGGTETYYAWLDLH